MPYAHGEQGMRGRWFCFLLPVTPREGALSLSPRPLYFIFGRNGKHLAHRRRPSIPASFPSLFPRSPASIPAGSFSIFSSHFLSLSSLVRFTHRVRPIRKRNSIRRGVETYPGNLYSLLVFVLSADSLSARCIKRDKSSAKIYGSRWEKYSTFLQGITSPLIIHLSLSNLLSLLTYVHLQFIACIIQGDSKKLYFLTKVELWSNKILE